MNAHRLSTNTVAILLLLAVPSVSWADRDPLELEVVDVWRTYGVLEVGDPVTFYGLIENIGPTEITEDFFCEFWGYNETLLYWFSLTDGQGVLVTTNLSPTDQVIVSVPDPNWGGYCHVNVTADFDPNNPIDPPPPGGRGDNTLTDWLCASSPDLAQGTEPYLPPFSPPVQLAGRPIGVVLTNLGPGDHHNVNFWIKWQNDLGAGWVDFSQSPNQEIDHDFADDALTYIQDNTLPVDYDLESIRVDIDIDNDIPEADESNNMTVGLPIPLPDLTVADIWWDPPNPEFGEWVTFSARIENAGRGGTTENFNVQFIVDYGFDPNAWTQTERVYSDTGLGHREPAFPNADFESGDLSGWHHAGGNFDVIPWGDPNSPQYRAYCTNYERMTSDPFIIPANADVLTFRVWETLAGHHAATAWLRAMDATALITQPLDIDDGSGGTTYVLDVRPYREQEVYFDIGFQAPYSYAYYLDDICLHSLSVTGATCEMATCFTQWQHLGGHHSITVIVDPNDAIPEEAGANNRYSIWINGNPEISIGDAEFTEGDSGGILEFTVTLSSAADDVTVYYQTSDASATAGEDYEHVGDTLEFGSETIGIIQVPILDDSIVEGVETFNVMLSGPTYAILNEDAKSAVGTINDNDFETGDLNCDGWVNNGDIDAFVYALSYPDQYPDEYPDCDIMNGDINGDGWMNNGDIDAFVSLIAPGR